MKKNVGIVTIPLGMAGNVPLSNLVDVVYPISDNLYLITGNEGYLKFKDDRRITTYGINYDYNNGKYKFTRILKYVYLQMLISLKVFKLSRVDVLIFFIGGDHLLLPVLTSKLLNKKVVLAFSGSNTQTFDFTSQSNIIDSSICRIFKIITNINCIFSDHIFLYSPRLINEWNLEKFSKKISIAQKHFLNFDEFFLGKKINERTYDVGYFGRFSQEKGILNFVKSISLIQEINHLNFLLVGDGELNNDVVDFINDNSLNHQVTLKGWIPHNKITDYLNDVKLIVIPSYTEGLPNLMLEAMACGTIVLASPVGSIPDVIKDGETGFLLDNNSPECIRESVNHIFEHPSLDIIAYNAFQYVNKEFTYEKAVSSYGLIFHEL
ncbi:MAG: glycosyltransferase [Desulfitobacteriaceae bacterium]|nr:glycosyltransferase [Desulfitobacteriaceae bacterium]